MRGVFSVDLTAMRCSVIVLAYRGTRMYARLVLSVRPSAVLLRSVSVVASVAVRLGDFLLPAFCLLSLYKCVCV